MKLAQSRTFSPSKMPFSMFPSLPCDLLQLFPRGGIVAVFDPDGAPFGPYRAADATALSGANPRLGSGGALPAIDAQAACGIMLAFTSLSAYPGSASRKP
jgi:hypothetical protein